MIRVQRLNKQYNGQSVLKDIDLSVEPGEVIAIIGPSGSGKTTFLRCLNLLETPDSGVIQVGDIKIDASNPISQQAGLIRRLRQQVGFVFQNFNLFPHRTALENVIEGPTVVKKMPREAADASGPCAHRLAFNWRGHALHLRLSQAFCGFNTIAIIDFLLSIERFDSAYVRI